LYDAFGRRESFDDLGVVESYLYDAMQAVQTSNALQNFFTTPDGEVLVYSPSSGTFVPLTDVLGSTIGLVNSSGTIATKWAYEPFGVPTSSGQSSNYPYLFAGMEYDPTGLYHTLARYYSPRLQRFTQEDPLQFGGGDINLFAYVGNDPVNLADPLGMDVPGVFAAFGYCMYGFAGDAGALSSGASLSALVATTVDLPNNGFGRASLAFSGRVLPIRLLAGGADHQSFAEFFHHSRRRGAGVFAQLRHFCAIDGRLGFHDRPREFFRQHSHKMELRAVRCADAERQ
jgi:RHS repeat-associated protein